MCFFNFCNFDFTSPLSGIWGVESALNLENLQCRSAKIAVECILQGNLLDPEPFDQLLLRRKGHRTLSQGNPLTPLKCIEGISQASLRPCARESGSVRLRSFFGLIQNFSGLHAGSEPKIIWVHKGADPSGSNYG